MGREIEIVADFTGYPDDTDASRRLFKAGETPDDLPDAYADLLVAKGLARATPPKPAARADKTERKS